MPEGDTIHNVATRLRPALEGKALVRFEAHRCAGPLPKPGTIVTAVEAYGKHLLIHFADGHVLRTHLRMTGRWDLYRTDERWRRPAYLARAVVEVDGWVAVCFSAPVVEVTRERMRPSADPASADLASASGHRPEHPGLAHLGPDLCRDDADIDDALRRMNSISGPSVAIAEVLLDQRVAAGIGNVFKSEVLWACRVHPLTPLGEIDEPVRRRLLRTAAQQLRANLGPGRRSTVSGPPGSVAVYDRSRRPCRRCGTPIRQRTGPASRSTYWCPTCQPVPEAGRT
jgi:endonuclease VIII